MNIYVALILKLLRDLSYLTTLSKGMVVEYGSWFIWSLTCNMEASGSSLDLSYGCVCNSELWKEGDIKCSHISTGYSIAGKVEAKHKRLMSQVASQHVPEWGADYGEATVLWTLHFGSMRFGHVQYR